MSIFEAVYSWVTTCLEFSLETFVYILDQTGTGGFYLSGMFVIILVGFFLVPLFRRGISVSGGSDKVSKVMSRNRSSDSSWVTSASDAAGKMGYYASRKEK